MEKFLSYLGYAVFIALAIWVIGKAFPIIGMAIGYAISGIAVIIILPLLGVAILFGIIKIIMQIFGKKGE